MINQYMSIGLFIFSGVFFLLLSKSRAYHEGLLKNGNEQFAHRRERTLRQIGTGLLILSGLMLLFKLIGA